MVQVTDVLPLKENDDIAVVIVGLLRCIGRETQFVHYYICVRIQLNGLTKSKNCFERISDGKQMT